MFRTMYVPVLAGRTASQRQNKSKIRLANAVEFCQRKPHANDTRNGNDTHPENDTPNIPNERKRNLSKRRPTAIEIRAAIPKAVCDVVDVGCMYRSTWLELERYDNRVREGVDLEAAVAFCRYVEQCGILKLFAAIPVNIPVRVDAELLRVKAFQIRGMVQDLWRRSGSGPVKKQFLPKESKIESIERKLNVLLNAQNILTDAPELRALPDIR